MNILVVETNNINEFMKSDTFKAFDNDVRECKRRVKQEHLNYLKNYSQKKIFLDWCGGKCVSSVEYINTNNVSKEDNYEAHPAILSVISLGFG